MIEAILLEQSWHYKVRSANKRKYYDVVERRDGTFSCSCPAFKYHAEKCKHIQAVEGL